jgi:hypothetical protein
MVVYTFSVLGIIWLVERIAEGKILLPLAQEIRIIKWPVSKVGYGGSED